MSNPDQTRELIVDARMALLLAELALSLAEVRQATIQIDLAQAYIAEARKSLPPIWTAEVKS